MALLSTGYIPVVLKPTAPKHSKKSLTNVIVNHCSGICESDLSTIYKGWMDMELFEKSCSHLFSVVLVEIHMMTKNIATNPGISG